ncbi:hypothetical protein GQX73_g5244 [Xylaria multiplex]|uniref:Uncharacterized protein n=1 Tax=Xylaria multiplex TaxID=323545 RepID=A0A7C8MTQ0_9PEZI|nr:hypothetical protein GQX73_g5244 [Xylaria multiplex]
MTTHVNNTGRPTLAPLWTNQQGLGKRPTAAFRTAQGPLLSPSPMSAASFSSPVYPPSFNDFMRKKDRALVNSLSHKTSPSSVSSPMSLASVEGQSLLVSKLEKASMQLTDTETPDSPLSPLSQGNSQEAKQHPKFRPKEDYGNIRTADAFIIARSIRRNSDPATETSRPFWEDGSSGAKLPRRLILRAIIRPKAPGRQAFLIQRNLDIDEIRATASASALEKYHQSTSPSGLGRKPLPVPAKWSSTIKRPSMGLSPLEAEPPSKTTSHSTDYDRLIRDPKTVPIHTYYVISALPALSALLTSGHVRDGDILYLPVPHAESWPQTVLYVYTGQGELTTAMRENILYLGGRV